MDFSLGAVERCIGCIDGIANGIEGSRDGFDVGAMKGFFEGI